ncbi:hypothetical protein [Mucilaginibacter inviolabilis]|uniref:hypothetical protein n=1 Tax=Mucilaginibacter inviolabilis TaxID=2714892 RepID=UPI00140DEAB9|nr:hypothetical protein [Mucilaginibacter inviolabilis]
MYTVVLLAFFLAFFTIIILLNIYALKHVISKAIEKFIKPKLQDKGYGYIDYKWLGFFNHGDFKNDKLILVPGSKFGSSIISTYIDIYYSEQAINKKITVRIDSTLVFIKKVLYSKQL